MRSCRTQSGHGVVQSAECRRNRIETGCRARLETGGDRLSRHGGSSDCNGHCDERFGRCCGKRTVAGLSRMQGWANAGTGFCILWILVVPLPMQAVDFYVSPSGSPSGPGTMEQPYDLPTALSGQVSQAGDTFWLRGGTYALGHVDTTIEGAAGRPITFRQNPGEKARVNGSISFFNSSG